MSPSAGDYQFCRRTESNDAINRGLANAFGIFQSHYQAEILSSYSPSTLAWIGTAQGFLVNIVGVISGRAYDLGYVRPFIYGGAVLNVGGLIATSFSNTYPTAFVSLGICVGLGSGAFYVPSLAIIASHFSTRLPLATGISATGASLGGVLYPVIFRALIDRLGFAWTCRIFAIVNGGLLSVSCILIRPPRSRPTGPSQIAQKKRLFDPTAMRDVLFILFSLSLFLLWLGVDVPFFFLPTFVQEGELGRSNPQLGDYLLAVMNAASVFGRIFLGYLAVRLGSVLAVWEASIAASCLLLVVCWAAAVRSLESSLPGIIIFVILYGIFTGGVISLVSPALLAISPDVSVVGTRLGMSSVCAGVGFLIGPPIAGAIQSAPTGYLGQGVFSGLVYAAALAVLGLLTCLKHRRENLPLLSLVEESQGARSDVKTLTSDITVSSSSEDEAEAKAARPIDFHAEP